MTAATKKGARAKPPKAPARPKAKKPATAKATTTAKPVKATKKVPAKQAKAPKAETQALTPLQEQFALEYVKDFNGSRAYRAVKPNATDATCRTEASKLLANPNVQAFAKAARDRIAAKLELTAERTLLETARLAYFDPRKLFAPDGSPLPINELDDDTAAALAGLEVTEEFEGSGQDRVFVGYTKKYKVADKNAALERASKILGLFKKDNEQAGNALGQALAKFVAQFHGNDAGRLKVSRG